MNEPLMIKSFRARNLPEALLKIRRELGPDAIILETKQRHKSRFSWYRNQIEVTASSGPHPDAHPAKLSDDEHLTDAHPTRDESIDSEIALSHDSCEGSYDETTSYPQCFVQVGSELLMRDLPRERIESWLREALATLGTNVCDPWMVRAYLAQILRREIPIASPAHTWSGSKSAIAVVGPSGHGKSSAVAKLANLASMHLGLQPLIISCLHPSTPPHPRLADYCELMGWNYEQVDAPKLASAIASGMLESDWIVLDIPSVPVGDVETMEMWRAILEETEILQTHLTISATTAPSHARRLLEWYQGFSPSHLLVTHLDEAFGLGAFYPFLSSAKLPIGFATFGPNIPNDIIECDGSLLAQWILGSDGDEPDQSPGD